MSVCGYSHICRLILFLISFQIDRCIVESHVVSKLLSATLNKITRTVNIYAYQGKQVETIA